MRAAASASHLTQRKFTHALLTIKSLPYMHIRIHTLVFMLALLLTGCASAGAVESTTEAESETAPTPPVVADDVTLDDALSTAEALASDLQSYEEQRGAATSQVDQATSRALSVLDDAPSTSEVREATRIWRDDWDAVRNEMDALATRYADASATATGYFHHLDAQTSSIADNELRDEEQEHNDELHASWRTTSGEAVEALRTIRSSLRAGDDLHVTMLNASLRSGFDAHVERLRTLSDTIKEALASLESVTTEGEALVGTIDSPESDSTTASAEDADNS